MAYCSMCGSKLPEGAKFCPSCSAQVPGTGPQIGPTVSPEQQAAKRGEVSKQLGCAIMAAVAVVLFLFAYCATDNRSYTGDETAAEEPSPSPIDLDATVRQSPLALSIMNNTTDAWSACEVELNPGFVRDGFKQTVDEIPAGETVIAPLGEFSGPGGERFDPASREVQTVFMTCTLADGSEGSGSFEFE